MAVADLLSFSTLILITSPFFNEPLFIIALCKKTLPCFLQSKIVPVVLPDINLPESPTCPPDSP